MEYSNKIEKKAECLNRIIDHLNLLKQNEYQLAQIEKDIILQDLREAYVNILSMEVTPLIEEMVQEEMAEEILVAEPAIEEVKELEIEEVKEEEVEEIQEEEEEMTQVVEEILAERVSEEEEAAEMAMEEEPDVYVDECINEETEEIEEDIQDDIIVEVIEEIVEEEIIEENIIEEEIIEEKIIEEEVIEEDIIEEQETELPGNKPENLEIENDLDFLTEEPKPEVQQAKQEESIRENRVPDLFAELETAQTAQISTNNDLEEDNTPDDFGADMEADDISHFLGNEPKMPTSSQSIEIEPVVEEEVEEVEVVAMEPPITTPDLSTPPQETTVNTKIEEPAQPEKPAVRSLNDLLNENKEDKSLNTKFQNVKVTDLTKSISINDKFLFIRELFRNRGEEFSAAIQTFNNCQNIDDAFNYMETLKKQYFWDSTSTAYLTFCDLIRRKF